VGTVTLFDPTAPRGDSALPSGGAGLKAFSGAVVGFVDNAKPNFDHLVDAVAELLISRYGVKQVIKRRKPSASVPARPEILDSLAGECDVVIAGSGD